VLYPVQTMEPDLPTDRASGHLDYSEKVRMV